MVCRRDDAGPRLRRRADPAIALLAGIGLRMDRIALLGLAFDPNVLNLVFVLNVVVLIYRVVAIVDAIASPNS